MEPNVIAVIILSAGAFLAAHLYKLKLLTLEEDRAALEQRLAEKSDELWTANAHLRAAALGRREDGRRIQLYRRIFAEAPIGLAILRAENPQDPESWIIVEFNPSGLRLSAAGDENPAGRRLLEFSPAIRDTELPAACAEAVRMNRAVEIPDFLSRGRVPGGRFSINAFPLGGPYIGLAFENITARKAAEEALARSNADLSQFAYIASHDLQAPVRKISVFAEHLKRGLGDRLDATGADLLKRIALSAASMQALIEGLLELARVDASAEKQGEVDLSALADEALGEFDDEIARRGARVERGELGVVLGDRGQLRRLLVNLIGNALKFTPADRAPRVRILGKARDGGRTELLVEDEGAGFEMKFADRLFQPFQRLHSRAQFPGSGMGLAICRKIVERHRGTISIRSSPGRGTRVSVGLRAAPVRTKEAASWNSALISS